MESCSLAVPTGHRTWSERPERRTDWNADRESLEPQKPRSHRARKVFLRAVPPLHLPSCPSATRSAKPVCDSVGPQPKA